MHIWFSGEKGFGWTEVAITHKHIAPLYKEWGEAGMYYLTSFGHPFSLHGHISDLAERDTAVIEEMRSLKNGLKTGQSFRYPVGYYKNDTYKKAEEAMLLLGSVPEVNQVAYLKRKLSEYQRQEDDFDWINPKADPDKYNKQITSATNLRKLITQTAKELSEAEAHLQKMCSRSGLISLDEIWMNL